MSWIAPTFGGNVSSSPPLKKRNTTVKTPMIERVSHLAISTQSSSCNWLQQHAPRNVDELAVNVKKVKELQEWLEQSTMVNSKNKFMLLTGPSGCGKTTTLQTLCKSLAFKVLEWINPLDKTDSEYPSPHEGSKSASKLFEEFLFRSSRYNSCLSSNPTRKLVLVKDFPNAFLHNPSVFQEILENFSEKCVNPVVFICSDESHIRKLFSGLSVQVSSINFNPITDQRMFKVLKGILLKESKNNKSIKVLSDEALHAICAACQGDLRSAITKLYFVTIKSDFSIPQLKSEEKFKKPKPPKSDDRTPTDKDKRLDFFHGVGRVLYPKKSNSSSGIQFVHSTESIVGHFLCEPKGFLSQLHENYPTKFGNIYEISDAAERLSKSDLLVVRWQDRDIFNTYALSVAVQGLMVCNKNPQKAKFEAFRKSQTARMEVDCKAMELEGKSTFSEFRILDYGSLLELLPYSELLLPNLSTSQLDYVRKTCKFKNV